MLSWITVHGSRNVEKLLSTMHFLFHNVPAGREDYTSLTSSSVCPLPFCGHRWVENLPVAERANELWPKLQEYVAAVQKNPYPYKISRTFCPILTKYQTDEPVRFFLITFFCLFCCYLEIFKNRFLHLNVENNLNSEDKDFSM